MRIVLLVISLCFLPMTSFALPPEVNSLSELFGELREANHFQSLNWNIGSNQQIANILVGKVRSINGSNVTDDYREINSCGLELNLHNGEVTELVIHNPFSQYLKKGSGFDDFYFALQSAYYIPSLWIAALNRVWVPFNHEPITDSDFPFLAEGTVSVYTSQTLIDRGSVEVISTGPLGAQKINIVYSPEGLIYELKLFDSRLQGEPSLVCEFIKPST